MIKLRNYGPNGKLISKHTIMINELKIMITTIFMMKVMIIKNKYMNYLKQQHYYKHMS